DPLPTLSYAGSTGTSGVRGTAMSVTPSALTAGAGGSISSCAVTDGGSLPTGLSLHNTTCVISGTPSTVLDSTEFTITVTNSYSNTEEATVTLYVGEVFVDQDNSAVVGFAKGTHYGTAFSS